MTEAPKETEETTAVGRDEAHEAATDGEATEQAAAPEVGPEAGSDGVEGELEAAQRALAERTADLQRLQAEYLNYKRRVDRDRELIQQNATYSVLAPITEVIDTIDRAREHGPLEDGLKAVADQLERVVSGLGLVKFGAPGDAFDPSRHEALSHIGEDPEVAVTTCKIIARAGYQIGDRVVRAAQVLVVDPAAPAAGGAPDAGTAEATEAAEAFEAGNEEVDNDEQ